jgi:hypothetical protein
MPRYSVRVRVEQVHFSLRFPCVWLFRLIKMLRFITFSISFFNPNFALWHQSAITQANRRRAERPQLPFNPDQRTSTNVKFCEVFSVG